MSLVLFHGAHVGGYKGEFTTGVKLSKRARLLQEGGLGVGPLLAFSSSRVRELIKTHL